MAAGNSGGQTPLYPARYANQYGIAVGAIDENEDMASFSNRAGVQELTYVTAPGVDIYSTLPNNKYDSYRGTSMATPHVAGVVALMLSANHNLDSNSIRQILEDTSGGGTEEIPLFPGFGDIFPFNLSLGNFPESSFESSLKSNLNPGYTARSFNIGDTGFDLNNTSIFDTSANDYLYSQLINYQQNIALNLNTQIYSSAIESIFEEDEILFEFIS